MREDYEVTLARAYVAGEKLNIDTPLVIARSLIAQAEEVARLRGVVAQYHEAIAVQRAALVALRQELADTQRERNRNREYVGECAAFMRDVFDTLGKGHCDSMHHEMGAIEDRVEAMAREVGQ